MPPQLKVLLPLFALFILLFIGVRAVLVPKSFGRYGHYRADAIDEIAAEKTHYAGKAACIECHTAEATKLESDLHSDLTCEVCHGPGDRHIASTKTTGLLKRSGDRETCGICHEKNPARNTEYVKQVKIREHHIERKNCIECHNPHAVWDLKK
jgi:hypothetical protein